MNNARVTITVYTGLDRESRIAERVVKEAQAILGREYGLPIHIVTVPLPLSSDEAGEYEIPLILINGKPYSKGKAPLISEVIDMVFEILGEEMGVIGSILPEFQLGLSYQGG